jgi:hypothetical protein
MAALHHERTGKHQVRSFGMTERIAKIKERYFPRKDEHVTKWVISGTDLPYIFIEISRAD